MRKKELVPIGQGCKRRTISKKDKVEDLIKLGDAHLLQRCECHFWLYLNFCLGCGNAFHSEVPFAKTCSDKCRKRVSRMRHEKLFQMVMKFADGAA
jgi:predicted nucleic acid-binding Zn ribbon protein